ncbi:TonB-dependent receptor [Thalassospira sp.]|uniref:TonB-dependent receptor n=1 Tax=Thalassospira sp. TaxID=1912094 RepID=UPI0025DD746B|nr:TonB-dependent receptor [Thalassospira sp.]|tara:strand:- start:2866 stop:5634 length:2769 start_codon:yes stop_codon:yes gene_type:complete
MPSDGVGRLGDTKKTTLKTGTSLGDVTALAFGALGCGLIAIAPVGAAAQSIEKTSADMPSAFEIAQANSSSSALSNETHAFDIAPQPLAMALVAFSRISGVDVAIDGSLPDGVQSTAISGEMSATEALDRMLSQSGLVWQVLNATTISVIDPSRTSNNGNDFVTAPVVVKARRRAVGPNGVPDEVYSTPGSVAVITQESMRKAPVREAREIFNNVAGVDIANDAQDPGLTVNVRGQQEMGRVNVNIDGARQNYNQLTHGTSSRVYVDPALLAEVEVEKSDLAKNGGAGTSAGIVTMRTLNTQDILDPDEDWGGKVNLSRGTNQYDFAGDVAVGARVSPKFDLSAAVSRKVVGDYRPGTHNPGLYQEIDSSPKYVDVYSSRPEYSYVRQTSGLVKANLFLTEDQEINLGYVGSSTSYTKSSDSTNNYQDHNKTDVHTLTAKHVWNPESDLIAMNSGVYWTRTQNHQFRPARYNTSGAVTTDSFDNQYTLDTLGGEVSNSSSFDFDLSSDIASHLGLDYGVEYFQDTAKTSAELGGLGGAGAAYEIEGGTPAGERDVSGGFVAATYDLNNMFELRGGLRYDRYSLTGDSYWCEEQNSANLCEDGGTPLNIDLSEDGFSPSVGASVNVTPGIQLFANYRRNMRAPTIMESMIKGDHIGDNAGLPFYSNANLKPEESETKEVGVNFSFDNVLRQGDGFRAKVAYYRTAIDNYITLANVPQPTPRRTNLGVITNTSVEAEAIVNLTDPVYINGTEAELSYDAGEFYLGGTISISDTDLSGNHNPYVLDAAYDPYAAVNYTQLGATYLSYSDVNYGTADRLFGIYAIPKRKYTVDGGFRLFDQDLVLGMRASFVYPQDNFGSSNSSSIVSEYFKYRVFDFYSSYEINENLTLRFAVNNMLDEAYVQGTGGTFAPAPGRTAILTFSGNF